MTKKVGLLSAAAVAILSVTGVFVYLNIREHSQYSTVPQTTQIDTVKDTDDAPAEPSLTGVFMGRDAVHRSSGQAVVIETADGPLLQFNDFSVTPGPDLFVYLSPNAPDEDLGAYVSLDRLKSTSGPQTYNLPENYKDYRTVVIWCRSFSVTFATAELQPV